MDLGSAFKFYSSISVLLSSSAPPSGRSVLFIYPTRPAFKKKKGKNKKH